MVERILRFIHQNIFTNKAKTYFYKFLKWFLIGFFGSSIFFVILYRFINPPITPLMVIRYVKHDPKYGKKQLKKDWVDIKKISPNLILAAVAAEDNKFTEHFGIDFEAIQDAFKHNQNHRRIHGGSTITQQTAKNVFLWPRRSYFRKGLETYFTFLIEIFWSKKRIMEVYLNVIEMGRGIYGAEIASKTYFHKPAAKLTRDEAAMLAAIFPSPRRRNPAKPSEFLVRRQQVILEIMDKIGKMDL